MDDSFDLQRFVAAQDDRGTYAGALGELQRGRKQGHWIWYVLPQVAGLGRSQMSRQYALAGLAEARAYLDHPVLGPRLLACCQALLDLEETDPERVLGGLDAAKLRSSMTLFALAAPDEPAFDRVLQRFFAGRRDPATEELVAAG